MSQLMIPKLYDYEDKFASYLEQDGIKLYDSNKNYKNIANVMENDEFRKLYNNFFDDPVDMKMIISFMKVYEHIEKTSQVPLSRYQKISIMDKMFKNRDIRREIVNSSKKLLNY